MHILKRLAKPQQWGFVFAAVFLTALTSPAQSNLRWKIHYLRDTLFQGGDEATWITIYNDSDHPITLATPPSQFPWYGWDGKVPPPPGKQEKILPPHGQAMLWVKPPTSGVGDHLKHVELMTDDPSQPRLKMEIRYFVRLSGIPEFEREIIDFGKVPNGERLRVVFRFRNVGSAPLEVTSCKTGGWGPARYPHGQIKPGQLDSIQCEIIIRPGFSSKGLSVQFDRQPPKWLQFKFEGVEQSFHAPSSAPAVKEEDAGHH